MSTSVSRPVQPYTIIISDLLPAGSSVKIAVEPHRSCEITVSEKPNRVKPHMAKATCFLLPPVSRAVAL